MLELYLRKQQFLPNERPTGAMTVIACEGLEDRTRVTPSWGETVSVLAEDRSFVRLTRATTAERVGLREPDALKRVLLGLDGDRLVLDVTGMPHHVWAPILRVLVAIDRPVSVAYVEPEEYRRNPVPLGRGDLYDLSERIEGIGSLPGFAVLSVSEPTREIFVPLLGFEGARTLFIGSQLDLLGRDVLPVVPVPGFRLEYPRLTYLCNEELLERTKAWGKVLFAAANDVLEISELLLDRIRSRRDATFRIALTGTKPHAVGAVLLALARPEQVELLYDYPIPRETRARGASIVALYDLDGLVEELREV